MLGAQLSRIYSNMHSPDSICQPAWIGIGNRVHAHVVECDTFKHGVASLTCILPFRPSLDMHGPDMR